MSTATEVKLLTLLNVSAVKRPRERDLPGGHRGSPSVSRSLLKGDTPDRASPIAGKAHGGGDAEEGRSAKRRKSVTFGGELGPSGSGGKKGKGKAKEVNGGGGGGGGATSNGNGKGHGVKLTGVNGGQTEVEGLEVAEGDSDEEQQAGGSGDQDMFNLHFGAEPAVLNSGIVASAEANEWASERRAIGTWGRAVELRVKGAEASGEASSSKTRIVPSLLESLNSSSTPNPHVSLSLAQLGSYKDFYLHSLDGEADGSEKKLFGEEKEGVRKAAAVHALNHVLKTRRKIIRNNEKLAHAAAQPNATSMPDPPRDQSFTRPKVLFLLPLRSLALQYLTTHLFPLAPTGTQTENLRPFTSSFSVPADTTDPLSTPEAERTFPVDHLANFRGNSDDNFRIGIKITRKAWRVVMMPAHEAKLMECDILVASPLGMRQAAEQEGSTDLLSSIEICVADGCDVMQMQNWEHVQFVFNNLNHIPASPHGCDFSRVKPWYLESHAKYLRQTILLSRYDTPETRSLFHSKCHNLAGKVRLEPASFPGVLPRIRPGVRQIFERVDLDDFKSKGMGAEAAVEEVEARLKWFTEKTVPALLKSAVSRQNTIVVIPSYFDFVRVVSQLRKADTVTFAAISEYSSNAEISKARTTFFKGKKALLLVTERFHFYRRYRLRGAKTIVWYAPPEHAQFYAEFLETPFLPSIKGGEVDVDEGEVSGRALFSRFDGLRLERIVGTADARRMLGSGEGRFEFI